MGEGGRFGVYRALVFTSGAALGSWYAPVSRPRMHAVADVDDVHDGVSGLPSRIASPAGARTRAEPDAAKLHVVFPVLY